MQGGGGSGGGRGTGGGRVERNSAARPGLPKVVDGQRGRVEGTRKYMGRGKGGRVTAGRSVEVVHQNNPRPE